MNHRRRFNLHPLLPRWIALLALTPAYTMATPAGGTFVTGSGSIIQNNASTTTITQTSQQAALNWQSFNVSSTQSVNFIQPNATALAVNRIFDTNGSQILGQIHANGQIWLINPNGILFGASAVVNVGALVASTLDIQNNSFNDNFSDGKRSFAGSGTGSVINMGSINAASGGYVALLANQVSNQGSIIARLGTVALGAGSAATLSFDGNHLLHLQVDQSTLNNLAANGGLLRADGGLVMMSAGSRDSLLASVVNNTGTIEARTVTEIDGKIILQGGMQAGTAQVGGTLNTSAAAGGKGGFIETSAAKVQVDKLARINTAAADGSFGTWLIDPQDFNIAVSGGNISGTTLSANLQTTSVSLQSSNGISTGSGNLNVNDAVSWSANTTLTLTSSNNVNVNANITATGATAGLNLNPNTANGAEAASTSGVFQLQRGAAITLSGANTSLSIAGINYTVIKQLSALQDMALDPAAHYALGTNIDAAETLTMNGGHGFTPIGSIGGPFTGTFDGLGNVISNLHIDLRSVGPVQANVGLIGAAGIGSVIRNVGVVNGNVKGGAGTGGLVGSNTTGTISNSYFTGTVTGDAGTGGLVGSTISGSITDSYSIGNVSGNAGTGGLVGSTTSGNISNSYSTGNISGNAGTGGLVGSSTSGNVSNSYHIGTVAGAAGSGGLVGSITSGNVSQSYHTGDVSGQAGSGGLVGSITSGSITNTYSVGNVIGAAGTGGLAGSVTSGTVQNSYAVGTVSGAAGNGGLLGATSGPVISSYWDNNIGPVSSVGGGSGLSSAQMLDRSNFSGWDFAQIWTSFDGTRPLLNSLMTQVSVTANNASKIYDGLAFAGNNGVNFSTLPNGIAPTGVTFTGSSQGAVNVAGTPYVITPGGLQSSQLVHYNFIDGTLTITPFAVSLTGNRAYDGSINMLASSFVMSPLVGSESLSLSGTGTLLNKNVGSAKTVNAGSLTMGNVGDSLASNYSFTNGTLSATITQAAITIGSSAVTKTYDGGLSALGTAIVTSGSLKSGDSLSGGSFAFTDKNAGNANKTVSTSGVTVGDGTNNNNYTVSFADNTVSTINAAALTVSSSAVTKTYDGGLSALGSAIVTSGSLKSGDSLSGGSFAFTDKNVGNANKTVSTTGVTVGDGTNNNNYTVSFADNTASTINAAALTVSSSAVTKTYDGGLSALGTAIVTSGSLKSGDSLSGGSFSFTDKNAGNANKTVSTSGVTVGDGTNNNNYTVSFADNTASTINAAAITVGSSAVTKTYDGGLSALGTAIVTSGSLQSGDSLSGGSFSFTDKNVGNANKTVSISGVTVGDGTNNNNYTVSFADNTASTINAAAITVGSSAVTKTYDGGLSALGTAIVTSGSLKSGDSLSGGSFAFTDKNAGNANKIVSTSAVTVGDGTNNSNYTVSFADNTASTINAAAITVGSSAVTKTYDGGLSALGTAIVTSGSLKSGDSLSGGSFAFTDKNAGNANKIVSTSAVTVGDGTNNSNYTVSFADNTASTINRANVVLTDVSVNNKVVDGNTNATLAGTAEAQGLGSDVLTVGGTPVANFANAHVGGHKVVTISGFTLLGDNAGNYTLIQPSGLTANITPVIPAGSQPQFPSIPGLAVFDQDDRLLDQSFNNPQMHSARVDGACEPICQVNLAIRNAQNMYLTNFGVSQSLNKVDLHE